MRTDYLKDTPADVQHIMEISRLPYRLPLVCIRLQSDALTGDSYLHAVEALLDRNGEHQPIIRVRVIVNNRGMNVSIPCASEAMHQKYLDLRFQIRNTNYVGVCFDEIFVIASKQPGELYLLAHDFKLEEVC